MNRNKLPFDPRHLGVPLGRSKMIFEPMVRLAETVHLSSTNTNTISKRIETRFHMTHQQGVPSGASTTISMPMVHSVQTVQLSCTNTNTVSKRTETRFHKTHVPKEFHLVHPKRFSSLRYVRRKPCSYLAPTLTLSPNGRKQDSK